MRKPEIFFTGIFFAFCLALIGGVWWSVRELQEYQEEYYTLENELAANASIVAGLEKRNKILRQITSINLGSMEIISDAVEFYSHISRAVENNNVNILSMSTDGNNLRLQLRGDYYDLANVFADWRAIPFVFRVSSLTIKRSNEEPKFFVDVSAVLEMMTE